MWFIGNFPPPWSDESGALNNRLLQWFWEAPDGTADDSMLNKMLSEPRIILILLKAYKKLRMHIQHTPSHAIHPIHKSNDWLLTGYSRHIHTHSYLISTFRKDTMP
eukprot:COSAG02_NODE_1071_length_14802_cov_5.546419_3_plen_106_part_00